MTKLVSFLAEYRNFAAPLLILLVFLLLLFKDPFSNRTLIPNFEPYPDTFFYINPAINLVSGQGFNVNREGRIFNANVPPLYSLSLVPAFFLKADPRIAYYSNMVLSFLSLMLFWLILKKISVSKYSLYLLLILYVTNYFIYWVPSLIMAENLVLTLYLAIIYFLLREITVAKSIIMAVLAIGIYATKFASIPILISIVFLFFVKILSTRLILKYQVKYGLFFLIALVLCYMVLEISLRISKQYSVISQILTNLYSIKDSISQVEQGSKEMSSVPASWFGIQYIKQNLPAYISSLFGYSNKFLWSHMPLVPKFVAIGGVLGIFAGYLNKKYKFISFALFIFTVSTIIFQSTFLSFDARYIYIAIPTLLIGLGILLTIEDQALIQRIKLFKKGLIFTIIAIYLATSFTRIKSQISLNLRYAETPWNYLAILKTNDFFTTDKIKQNKKPVLISALPPFLTDYYSDKNYQVLPLSYEQNFTGQKVREIIWGPNDYSNLPKLYKKYLELGYDVYVSTVGIGEESYTNFDFSIIRKEFDTELVLQGCYDQCNIYSVKLKTFNAQ